MATSYRFIYVPQKDGWVETNSRAFIAREVIIQMADNDIKMAGFIIKKAINSDHNIPDGIVQVLRNGIVSDIEYVIDIEVDDDDL